MRKLYLTILLFALLFGGVAPTTAQDQPAYEIFSSSPALAEDGETLEAELSIFNGGGAASQPGTLRLLVFGREAILAEANIPALGAADSTVVTLSFPLAELDGASPSDLVVLEIRLASPEFNTVKRLIEFDLPGEATTPAANGQQPVTPASDDLLTTIRVQLETWLAFLPFDVDLTDRLQLAIFTGVVLAAVVLLWLITVILRLLFSSPPTFPNQPPPYANMPQLHPESLNGRRQMWQNVAGHGSMLADETEGNLHVRKVLLGTDGQRYGGWKVVGVRTSQYDSYGRISRTQVLATNAQVRKLTKAIERSEQLQRDGAKRRVRPVARQIARSLTKRVNRKTAGLPIALDVKFKGEHGEVGIQFLLYQYQLGAWRQLDSWHPEMTVAGKSMYETYTFTVFGKEADETMGAFRKRVRENMTYLLTEMVLCTPPRLETGIRGTQASQQVPQQQAQPPADLNATTTSSMHPVPPASEDTVAGAAAQENADSVDTARYHRPDR